jgi:hypothetical protein
MPKQRQLQTPNHGSPPLWFKCQFALPCIQFSVTDGSGTLKISRSEAANINWHNRVREYTNLLDEPVMQDGGLSDKLVLNNVKHMDLPLSSSAPGNEKGQQAQIWANRTGGSPEDTFDRIPRSDHQAHAPGDRHGSRSSSGPLQSAEPEGPQWFPVPQ